MASSSEFVGVAHLALDPLRTAFEEHYLPLLRMCFLLSGEREMAEDISQEAFSRAASRIPELEPARVRSYLQHVAINLWRSRLRRLAVERRLDLMIRKDEPYRSGVDLEERDALWQSVLRLPKRQRACLVLRYYEDLPEAEIARIVGCSVGTVKSHISRGLGKLRSEIKDAD